MTVRRTPPWLFLGSVVCLALGGCSAPAAAAHRASPTAGSRPTASAIPAGPASVTISPADSARSVPTGKPIVVSVRQGHLLQVGATDAAGQAIAGKMTADGSGWRSTSVLAPATTYHVVARADSAAGSVTRTSSFTTVTPSAWVYPRAIPLGGEMVGVGMVVRIFFTHPVVDEAATQRLMTVTSSKPVAGAWHWFGNDEVHYRPQTYWPAYDTITVRLGIGGRNLGGTVYGKTSRTITFQTGAAMVTVVSNATKHLQTYRDGKLVMTAAVSLGAAAHPSVSGTMLVMTVEHNHIMDSATYGVPADHPGGYRTNITWALRLTNSGQFLHSAPWSVAQQGHTNVTHGCINVSTGVAGWFYVHSHRGDVVTVTGTGVQIRPGDGWTDWRLPWAQWKSGSAL